MILLISMRLWPGLFGILPYEKYCEEEEPLRNQHENRRRSGQQNDLSRTIVGRRKTWR